RETQTAASARASRDTLSCPRSRNQALAFQALGNKTLQELSLVRLALAFDENLVGRIPAWSIVLFRLRRLTDKVGEHLLDRGAVGVDAVQKLDELFVVLPGKRADRVDGGEELVRLALVHIEDEDRHLLHAGQLFDAKMSVDEHEPAPVARVVGKHGACNAHFGKQALECIALVLGMRAPVLRIRAKLLRRNAAQLYDSVSDLHRQSSKNS